MIDILMATYNGEKYLSEQIESILNQTYTNWHLYIQDDLSTDNTALIANEYAQKYPDKITFVVRKSPSGSAKNNFFSMLKLAKSEYIMFSDQDDYWKPNKIEVTHNAVLEKEIELSKSSPVAAFTNLIITDENLNELSELFKREITFKSKYSIKNYMLSNNAFGCTIEFNRALLDMMRLDDFENIYLHDSWVAAIAVSFGSLVRVDTPTIYYRRHDENVTNMTKAKFFSDVVEVFSPKNYIKHHNYIAKKINPQIECFYKNYSDLFDKDLSKDFEKLIKSFDKNKLYKLISILNTGFKAPAFRTYMYYLIFC